MGDGTVLDRILNGEEDPKNLPLALLQSITNDFSDDRKNGQGGFGEVYKGVYNGEELAVKKFYDLPAPENKQFENECVNLLRIRHPNIVRLLGYCYETQRKHVEHNGELQFAQYISTILCFEYLQGVSLDKCLDESRDYHWPTRYNIIEGICEGLNSLHGGCGSQILHLDLKPANILLDKYMGAKVADFGLSRFFSKTDTHITNTTIGTEYYMPPEFRLKNQISPKNDVYSLGIIIIEIMAGRVGILKLSEMVDDVPQFVELVIAIWRQRIHPLATPFPSAELYQVETCIRIAITCLDSERKNRPTVAQIFDTLQETEKRFLEEWRSREGFLVGQSLPTPTKSGPRGGSGGKLVDIKEEPWRLHSLTINYQGLIDAFSFSYIDQAGKKQRVGPWGEENHLHKIETIRFCPSEFVEEVCGAYGSHGENILVTSLTFLTNIRTYGPFGNLHHQNVAATPFRFRADEGSSIVGFHGRSGSHLFSIGVYMYPHNKTPMILKGQKQDTRETVSMCTPQTLPIGFLLQKKKKDRKDRDAGGHHRRDAKEHAREIVRQAKETVTNRKSGGKKPTTANAGSNDKENAIPFAVEVKQRQAPSSHRPRRRRRKHKPISSSHTPRGFHRPRRPCARSPSTSSSSSLEDDPEYGYLRTVLERGWFMRAMLPPNRPFKGHSMSSPVDPIVFHLLELDLPADDSDDRREGPLRHRWNRKLLFHLAQEILADLVHLDADGASSATRPHGPALLSKVWSTVKAFPLADCRVVGDIDALVATDLNSASVRGLARHPAVAEEAGDVAEDVAELVLDALLRESLPPSWSWSPARAPR